MSYRGLEGHARGAKQSGLEQKSPESEEKEKQLDTKGNAEAGAGNGAPRNHAHPVRVHSIFRADCARAVVTLCGKETALAAVANSIPFWGHFEVERLIAEATDRLELGKKKDRLKDGVLVKGGYALQIGINGLELGEDEVVRAFVVDPQCVGNVEYIARHGLGGIVRPLRYDGRPVMVGAIVGRALFLAVEGMVERHRDRVTKVEYAGIVGVNNPTFLTAIFANEGRIAPSSEDTVQTMASGARAEFAIEDGQPVLQVRNPNGRCDVIAIDVAPARGVRLTSSHAVLKPVAGPAPSPAI